MRRRRGIAGVRPHRGVTNKRISRAKKAAVRLAVAFGLLWIATSGATAQDARVEKAVQLATHQGGYHVKLRALAELAEIDTRQSREAMVALADSSDERTSIVALTSLARADFPAARTHLREVFEDRRRSKGIRSAALGGLLKQLRESGEDHETVAAYVALKAGDSEALTGMASAVSARLWEEVAQDPEVADPAEPTTDDAGAAKEGE